jgi:hypothetical protein
MIAISRISRRALPSVLSITITSSNNSLRDLTCDPNTTTPTCNPRCALPSVPSITIARGPRLRALASPVLDHCTQSPRCLTCVPKTASPISRAHASRACGSPSRPMVLNHDFRASALRLPTKATTCLVPAILPRRLRRGTDQIPLPLHHLHLPLCILGSYTPPMTGLLQGAQDGEVLRVHSPMVRQDRSRQESRAQPQLLATMVALRG